MRILVLPRYSSNGPSSRVRMFNYLPYLKEAGFNYESYPFFDYSYIEDLFSGKKKNILAIINAYWRRIKIILQADKNDLIWLQYELLPWMPFWIEKVLLLRFNKLVIDYDDAVFDHYRYHSSFLVRYVLGKKISHLMAMASIIIVGNQYLADFTLKSGADHVNIIPSVIELEKYQPKQWEQDTNQFLRIGWIGSPSTVHYLLMIKDVILENISNNCTFTIIGADVPKPLQADGVCSKKWTIENEGKLLQSLDVGIMPLKADAFEQGKCGYKLIQYMACALPVVASPVGINNQLVKNEENGFLVKNNDEWFSAIETLKEKELRIKLGRNGREMIELIYNYRYQSENLINTFRIAFELSNKEKP